MTSNSNSMFREAVAELSHDSLVFGYHLILPPVLKFSPKTCIRGKPGIFHLDSFKNMSSEETPLLQEHHDDIYERFTSRQKRGLIAIVICGGLVTCMFFFSPTKRVG